MQGGYVSIDTLLGFAGFTLQIVILLIGAGVAWGKLQNLSSTVTKAMDDLAKRIQTLEDDGKKRSEDLARFATLETSLDAMKQDIHRIAAVIDARGVGRQSQGHTASPDILAGLRVLASLGIKESAAH